MAEATVVLYALAERHGHGAAELALVPAKVRADLREVYVAPAPGEIIKALKSPSYRESSSSS